MAAKKTVGIVGAGPSGLTTIKSCLEQGLQPVCFELLDGIGGAWHATDEHVPHQGFSMYEGVCTNTSKEMSCFSDFPMPEEWPVMVPHHLVLQYHTDYAEHFSLIKHITFKSLVTAIEPAADYAQSGRWKMKVKNLLTNGEEEMTFDFVAICSGYHKLPRWPEIPGLKNFKGELLHALKYRRLEEFRNKKVLVVGNQITAGDVSTDAGRVAKEVHLSVGSGAWLSPRTGPDGLPVEYWYSSRIALYYIPLRYNAKTSLKYLLSYMDQRRYGLGSDEYPFLGAGTFLNDEMRYMLTTGRVMVRANLVSLSERGAKFSDGTELNDIDMVFFATGFYPDYSYIKCPDLKKGKMLESNLYKWTFPVNDAHATLALIGNVQHFGSLMPLCELQARWVTKVFTQKCKLASKTAMKKDLQARRDFAKDYLAGRDGIFPWPLNEEIADLIGVLPRFWSLFFRSPRAAYQFLFGPSVPAWYRVVGPEALPDGLQQAMRSYWRAYNTPNLTRADGKMADIRSSGHKYVMALLVVCLGIWVWKLQPNRIQFPNPYNIYSKIMKINIW